MKFQSVVGLWILMTAAAMAQTLQTGMWVGGGPLAGAPAVQNAPFSAELVTIIERTADGGTGFHREMKGTVARNSQGMTYFEMQLASPAPEINKGTRITITDPALHTITTLDPQQKTAFISGNYNGSNAAGILPPGGAVAVSPVGTAAAMSTAANPAVAKRNPTEPASVPHAAFSGASPTAAGQSSAKTEELGSKSIEGLTVTGVQDNPREFMGCRWRCQDLQGNDRNLDLPGVGDHCAVREHGFNGHTFCHQARKPYTD